MKTNIIINTLSLCAVLLNQVAVEMNGGRPLPKLELPSLSLGLLSGLQPKQAQQGGARGCAIIGCRNPNRTKGYCAAHYQKLRMLTKTNRRPAAWKDNAAPGTVADLKLPRGRAASKLLAQQNAKRTA